MPSLPSRSAKEVCALIVAAVLFLACTAQMRAQNTIAVPGGLPTIQAAIDAANNGDTVLVAPGTYVENINFSGKTITVTSSGGPSVTIIDGNHNGTVVTFNQSETVGSVLSGFTIRNGYLNGGSGAGILVTSASPTITGNIITGNHAAVGAGIYINGGSPVISNNTITANDQVAAGDGGEGGGGILVAGSNTTPAAPQITGNTITNNSVASGGEGGGISVWYFSSPLIQGNLVSGNTAYNNGGGISLRSYNSPVVVNNLIVNNASMDGGSGAGIYVSPSSDSLRYTVLNNTVTGNSAFDATSGIYTTGFPQNVTFSNNIVVAAAGQTAVTCNTLFSSISPVFSYNDVYAAAGSSWTALCDHTSNPGNISADPLFIDPSGNFRLQSNSPAVDAGNNSASGLPSTDLDGNPRIVDGNGDGIAVVDMGAYELQPTTITLTPNNLTFNPEPAGTTSAPQTVTLANAGAQKLYLSLSASAGFAETDNCGGVVAAGASCAISVTFAPASTGSFSGAITLRDNAPQNPQTVVLTGTGGVPSATLTPASVPFGGQPVGTTAPAQTVTLTNAGNGPLTISSITATGDFSQTSNCGGSLGAGASCSMSVTFTPATSGTRQGTLTVTDNASGSPQSASLSGTGLVAVGSLSPVGLVFAAQPLGTSSAPLTATFSNSGNLALNLLSITTSGAFSETNNCGPTVAGGSNCTISVTFNAAAIGSANGTLTVTDSNARTYTATLSGTGVDFAVSASPGSASVARGGSVNYTITLAPSGGAFSGLVALTCAGLPSNSTCSFSPQSPVPGVNGATAVMTVTTNQPGTPLGSFPITVTGKSGALSHAIQVQLAVTKPKH